MKLSLIRLFKLLIWIITISNTASKIAIAQVTIDGTLNTQVETNGDVAEITGGETRGANLFHSFQDFSVSTGNEAFFNNANDINHIFSRVTGGNISNIDGLIRANGNASLFLINPAGIIFGSNARLDIGGSFYGSTADSILFEGGEFNAADLENPPLLTVNAPIGLRFRDNPGSITIRGNGNGTRLADSEIIDTQDALRVDANSTLGIIGGKINFENATLKTAGGRIEIGSVAGGEVNLVTVANGFTFDYSDLATFQDVDLSETSVIDASGNGGGNIQIVGRNILLNDTSAIEANTLGNAPGNGINIFASESIALNGIENENNSLVRISSQVSDNGTASAGDINIETGSLSIGDRAAIATSNNGQGNAGNIKITARNSISLASEGNISTITSSNFSESAANAGNIEITTGSLTVSDGALLFANNSGSGNAGNVKIEAANNVDLANSSQVIVAGNANSSGTIEVNANSLSIDNQSGLFSNNLGQGNGGDVTLSVTENIDLVNNSGIFVEAINGKSGNIKIDANSLTIENSSQLAAANAAQGIGGNITLNIKDNINLANNSTVFVSGTPGGSININAQNLLLFSDSNIFAGIAVDGGETDIQSGDIIINLTEDLMLDRLAEDQFSTSISNSNFGQGNSGEIQISARNITLNNGGIISSFTTNEGNTGNIELNASGNINLNGIQGNAISGISNSVNSEATGDVGEINVTAQNLTLTNGGQIESLVAGRANSGDINLDIDNTILIDGFGSITLDNEQTNFSSNISSNIIVGGVGNAGSINIEVPNLTLSENGQINTTISRGQGNAGNININADLITVLSSGIQATAFLNSVGNGGNVTINATNFSLDDNAIVSTSNAGQGNAGNINFGVMNRFSAKGGSLITSNIGTPQGVSAAGEVGEINIQAQEIVFSDTAQIQAGLFSGASGEPGVISVTATESIAFTGENTGIFSNNDPGSVGNASDTQLLAPQIFLDNGAVLQASNEGGGNGGNILIAADNLELGGNNQINAFTVSGTGGTVTLDISDNIILRSSNLISAAAFNDANGGIVNINADFMVAFPNGNNDIVASAEQGQGGNISINAQSIFGIAERPLNDSTNDINASSDVIGFEGTVDITTLDTNPIEGATELPMNIVESEQTIAQACSSTREVAAKNQLIVSGKGGIVPAPDLPLNSLNVYVSDQNTTDNDGIPPAVETSWGKIQPARGIKITDAGGIKLTAYRTDNSGIRLTNKQHNCS